MNSKSKFLMYGFFIFLLIGSSALMSSCGGGGGSSSPGSSNNSGGGNNSGSVSGVVADGYIANATVTVYSDSGLTTPIGSGTTNSAGRFSFTLNPGVSSVTSPVYLQSTGGIDLDTGLFAPTLAFVGTTTGSGINITPLTDSIYNYALTLGLSAAVNKVTGQLGISSADLYADPVTDSTTGSSVASVAASGTEAMTLVDGSYYVNAFHFDQTNINGTSFKSVNDFTTNPKTIATMNVTVSNHVISGSVSGEPAIVINGIVSGNNLFLKLTDTSGSGEIISVAGNIGLLGGITGTFIDFNPGPPPFRKKGFFVASVVPQSGVDTTKLYTAAANIYNGNRDFIAGSVISNSPTKHDLHWGQSTFNIASSGAITASNIISNGDTGTTIKATTDTLTAANGGNAGQMLSVAGIPTSIAAIQFVAGGNLFMLQPVGCRHGIYVSSDSTTGAIKEIGEIYAPIPGGIVSMAGGQSYTLTGAAIRPEMLGQPTATALAEAPISSSITLPAVNSGFGQQSGTIGGSDDNPNNDLIVFTGNVMAMKRDDDGIWNGTESNGTSEHIRTVEFFETGAFEGNEIRAGLTNTGEQVSNYPGTFVGMAQPVAGGVTPSFTGTLNFIGRRLYAVPGTDSAKNMGVVWGTMVFSGTTATINYHVPDDPVTKGGSVTGSASNNAGLYHLSFTLPGGPLDIFWPAGGRRAVWIDTDGNSGNVMDIGEAFITQ